MARRVITGALLVALVAAGCIAPPTDEVDAAALELAPAAPGWYALEATAGPDANITAFWWTVPEGGVYEDGIWNDHKVSVLEVALESDGRKPDLVEWSLLAFDLRDDELQLVASHVGQEGEFGETGPLAGDPRPIDAEASPFYVRLYEPRVGERFAFVLAARSEEPVSFRVLIRQLEADPWTREKFDWPSDEVEDVLALLDGEPAPLEVVATGAGMGAASYFEVNGILLAFPLHYYFRSGELVVDGVVSPDARPLAADRDQSFSTAFDRAGWTFSFGMYWAGNAEGTWRAEADAHGAAIEAGSRIVGTSAVFPVTALLVGFPMFYATGEGAGGSHAALAVDARSVTANDIEFLAFDSLSIGATLEELFGVPALSDAAAWGELPLLHALRHDGALTLVAPGELVVTRALPQQAS